MVSSISFMNALFFDSFPAEGVGEGVVKRFRFFLGRPALSRTGLAVCSVRGAWVIPPFDGLGLIATTPVGWGLFCTARTGVGTGRFVDLSPWFFPRLLPPCLFHGQGDTLPLQIDGQDRHFYLLTHLDHVSGRLHVAVGKLA